MALSLGWRANEIRESIWKGDPALEGVTAAALSAWEEDGDAGHLEPFVKHGQPTRLEFRNLNGDEIRYVRGPGFEASSIGGAVDRIWRLAFRIGINIVGMPVSIRDPEGIEHHTIVRQEGIRMLAGGLTDELERTYPGIVDFYGAMIFGASVPSDKEKKASSPPSTQTPSSAAVSIPDTMAASPPAEAA